MGNLCVRKERRHEDERVAWDRRFQAHLERQARVLARKRQQRENQQRENQQRENQQQQQRESPHTSLASGSTKRVSHHALSASLRSRLKQTRSCARTLPQLQAEIRKAGIDKINLILGVDFTKSNTWNGAQTNNGFSLHASMPDGQLNPYEKVINILEQTLGPLMASPQIPCYGFGDESTRDQGVFSFREGDVPCQGFEDVFRRYREIVQTSRLMGPTSFAPIIRRAIDIVEQKRSYHVLVIIADGQVTGSEESNFNTISPQGADTLNALLEASGFPLSIVMVGVGDGPFDHMDFYDTQLSQRIFDNFRFVNYHATIEQHQHKPVDQLYAEIAFQALLEIPDQYNYIKASGILKMKQPPRTRLIPSPPPQSAPTEIPRTLSHEVIAAAIDAAQMDVSLLSFIGT
eukprot:TRINITY_DN1915_c0_g4_i2.p1 TRINITY_DN1915_c0_g4~~TRINITY_DN1915_c0_g4_i2.p1  ORF type:complete len:404 (+),score=70.98 TRINITY_DN1915_c0_g4_i2:79-1290(+)